MKRAIQMLDAKEANTVSAGQSNLAKYILVYFKISNCMPDWKDSTFFTMCKGQKLTSFAQIEGCLLVTFLDMWEKVKLIFCFFPCLLDIPIFKPPSFESTDKSKKENKICLEEVNLRKHFKKITL